MDVYLVPLGKGRFEAYYEATDADEPEQEEGPGFWAGVRARFSRQLREAEDGRADTRDDRSAGLMVRLQRRVMRWIAEQVAEQRLLWHLGRARAATLYAPGDLSSGDAERILRAGLQRDADQHLRRLLLHTVGLVVSIPLIVLPGPNAIGYLFTFTVVGHFLAMRGARHGLSKVTWQVASSPDLTHLGHAWSLDAASRRRQIAEAADRLGLRRLARFVERMTAPTA